MGILSRLNGFHAAGEGPNENNTGKYGVPACSLYTELNPGDLHQKIEVKNEQGQKMISMHDRYSIDLYQPQHEKTVVAIVIQLQKMLTARRENNN